MLCHACAHVQGALFVLNDTPPQNQIAWCENCEEPIRSPDEDLTELEAWLEARVERDEITHEDLDKLRAAYDWSCAECPCCGKFRLKVQNHCGQCETRVCDGCWIGNGCGHETCEDCSRTCDHPRCEATLCPDCYNECSVCSDNFCPEHSRSADCSCCRWLCDGCSHHCSGCGNDVCDEHISTCDQCEEALCQDCQVYCESNERTLCASCHDECEDCDCDLSRHRRRGRRRGGGSTRAGYTDSDVEPDSPLLTTATGTKE